MLRAIFSVVCVFSLVPCILLLALWFHSHWTYTRHIFEYDTVDSAYTVRHLSGEIVLMHVPRGGGAASFVTSMPIDYQWKGFRFAAGPMGSGTHWLLRFPMIAAVAITGALPLTWLLMLILTTVRSRARALRGLCPRCSYDLRASPERCPECGFLAPGTDAYRADHAAALARISAALLLSGALGAIVSSIVGVIVVARADFEPGRFTIAAATAGLSSAAIAVGLVAMARARWLRRTIAQPASHQSRAVGRHSS